MNKPLICSAALLLSIPVLAQTTVNCYGQKNGCVGNAQTVNIKNGVSAAEISKLVNDAVKAAEARANIRHKADTETIKSLTAAVTALAQGQTHATPSQIDAAFAALRKGDFTLALSLFETEAERFQKEAKKGAEIQRNIGALAFLDDTQKSLKAYRRATQLDPDNADGWNRLGHLLDRIGELDEAINTYQTVLRLGQEHKNQGEIAIAYGNLGIVYQTRGDFDRVVEYYNKALKISENLGNKEKIATTYGNLGTVYQTRGDFDKVVEYYNKALKISENLGNKEKIATIYGNLGNVYQMRSASDKAVEYYDKSLKINESIGHKEGAANNYNQLGIVYQMRGDLDKALEYYNKALEIDKSLGRKEGMANDYANIGGLYATQKDYKKARDYWEKSLALFQALGSPNAKTVQSWLDELPQ